MQPTLQLAHPRNQRESSPWNAALEKQKQPLEVQPTFLALAKQNQPLDLSPRLDGERLRLHPYSPSGRNGYKKRKGSINRTKSGKGTSGIGK